MRNLLSWIRDSIKVTTITIILFLLTDFVITWSYGARGFSKFFVSNSIEGRMNKPGFSGGFGSILAEFHGQVNIGLDGERLSDSVECKYEEKRALFLGDSTTAGFEVDDSETFVSLLNKKCSDGRIVGINFGVRAHDTHAVIGTYQRIATQLDHDYVIYLMTENDFQENIDPNAYPSMSRYFGRRYEDKIFEPDKDLLFVALANLQNFVGDRLSFTSFILRNIARYLSPSTSKIKTNKQSSEIINIQVTKTFELIKKLASMAEVEGAKLIVIPYPSLGKQDIARDKKVALLNNLIHENLESVLYAGEIDKKIAFKVNLEGRQLFDLRYKRDRHLSEFGHYIISEMVINIMQDFQSNGTKTD